MAFTLRPYLPADFEKLFELDRACYPRGIAYSRRTLRWCLEAPGAACLLAEAADGDPPGNPAAELVGFIVTEAEPPKAHIITLDVADAWRRKGAGTALLTEMERRLAADGIVAVGLETATNNEAGVAFWKRHGYRAVGLLPRYYLGRIDAHAMVKRLAAAETFKE